MLEQVISNKAGWTRVSFGDVVRKVNDKVDPWESGLERYVAGDHMDTDDLRIRRWGLIGDDYLGPAFHMRFKPGHVLYGSRRTYLRKVALADFEGITANTTYVLETKDPSVLMPELLPFIMQTEEFHAHSIARSKGSVNPYINFSDIADFKFSLPPIQEQARLLEASLSIEAATESYLNSTEASKDLRIAFLNSHFLPRIKAGVPLQNVVTLRSGGTPARSNSDYWGGALPWASGKDLKVRLLSETEERLTESGWNVAKIAPAKATLIVVRGMILAHTFPVSVCQGPMAFNQDLRAMISGPTIRPEYLTMWAEWMGPWFLSRTAESSHGTKRLEAQTIENALIPIEDFESQDQLISQHDQVISEHNSLILRLAEVKDLKKKFLSEIVGGA